MCVIVYNREGKTLDKGAMRIAYENNPHGYGIMWYDGDRVLTLKEPMEGLPGPSFDAGFERLWNTLQKFQGIPYALHLRWRTRGARGREQCHPHMISDKDHGSAKDVYLMHNGTLSGLPLHEEKSDTELFALKLRFLTKKAGMDFHSAMVHMRKHVNSYDKLLFMNSNGDVHFENETEGEWINGIWFSNTYSFIPGYRNEKIKVAKQREEITTTATTNYWNDKGPVLVLRGTGTLKYNPNNQQKRLSKKKQRKLARRRAREAKLQMSGGSNNGWKNSSEKKASSLPPGRHTDSRGNQIIVTTSGAVLRVR